MASVRREREQQFLTGGATPGTLSVDLLESAFTLLRASLRDRRSLMFVTADNHFSSHATGTMVMAVTALDAWLNEVLVRLVWLQEDQRFLVKKSLHEKYLELIRYFGSEPASLDNLRLLCYARDEIVHFLPRSLGAHGAIPEWLKPLQDQRLLLERHPHGNDLPDKLCSYRLAYWAWSTVSAVVKEIVAASGTPRSPIVGALAGNFDWYEGVCSPDELAEYDARHNIKPTPILDDETMRRLLAASK